MAKRKAKAAVGVDAGGTYTKIGAVTASGRVLRETQIPAEVQSGPRQFAARVAGLIESWLAAGAFELAGVGLGLAGDVDSERGRLRLAPNLKGWEGFDFRKVFQKSLRCRVAVENDANAAVWGGFIMDLRKKASNVVGVTLGTGVGGGLIFDGRLYRGSTGSAGEIGHTVVEAGGEPCHCGRKGCLEAYVGKYGIVRLARRIVDKDPSRAKVLLALCPNLELLEPKHLSHAADEGDAAAREVWDLVGGYLAIGLANVVLLLNPDKVLILGGVSRAGHWILDPVERHFSAQPFRTPFRRVRVKLADNNRAGWVGAATLAMEKAS